MPCWANSTQPYMQNIQHAKVQIVWRAFSCAFRNKHIQRTQRAVLMRIQHCVHVSVDYTAITAPLKTSQTGDKLKEKKNKTTESVWCVFTESDRLPHLHSQKPEEKVFCFELKTKLPWRHGISVNVTTYYTITMASWQLNARILISSSVYWYLFLIDLNEHIALDTVPIETQTAVTLSMSLLIQIHGQLGF